MKTEYMQCDALRTLETIESILDNKKYPFRLRRIRDAINAFKEVKE